MKWQFPVVSAARGPLAVITLMVKRTELPAASEADILNSKIKLVTLTIEHHLMTEGIRWEYHHSPGSGRSRRPQSLQPAFERASNRSDDRC